MAPATHEVRDRTNAEHYRWGGVCDGWNLLPGPDLHVIQERVPPDAGEVAHRHARARQFFFVLEGEATLEFDHDSITFRAGQGVHVAPGTVHRFCNRGTVDVLFLVVSAPTTRGDRLDVA